jgi:hypothetical protein
LYENGGGVAGDKPVAIAIRGWYNDGETGYPVVANAVLMAAAPRMLEALVILLKDAEHMAENGDMSIERESFAIARAAIAKAKP